MKEFFPILAASPLFSGVTEDELDAMLTCLAAKTEQFPKDVFLLHPGDTVEEIGMVLSGCALVVQEAMAAGLPVVATDTGGIPDLMRVGGDVVGRLVPVGDAAATVDAVRGLLAAPATRDEIAARGREVARGWPDRAGTARDWEEKYARVLG